MAWPSWFPSSCPPADASPATGTLFRIVERDPPTASDFMPLCREQPGKDFGERLCMASGLSVYRKRKDAELTMTLPTFRGKTCTVAAGELDAELGVLKATPPKKSRNSHHTWWVPDGADPSSRFQVCEEGGA